MTTIIILSDSEKAIFDAICRAARNEETTPTLDQLRHVGKCSRDRAGILVKCLEAKGLLSIGGDGSSYRVYHITESLCSTTRAEPHVHQYSPPADMDRANRRHVAAICRYHINHGKPHWRKNLLALGELV